MDTEKVLPTDLRLNTYFGQLSDELHQEVDELQERQDGDIVDREQEFASAETVLTFDTLAQSMNELFFDSENDESTREAIYRAAVFAFQSICLLLGERTGFQAGPYFLNLIDEHSDSMLEQLTSDVHTYLGSNPNVDAFIGYYMEQIDEGRDRRPEIELVAGLLYLLIERHEAEHFIEDAREHMSMENFVN